MKKLFTLKKFVAVIFMILTAMVINAQTEEKPWHVVVYDAEGEEIVATYSVEVTEDMVVSGQNVNILLTSGAIYSYPITSVFGFEQRAGNGTAIKTITTPKWNAYYGNGSLHFTEPVKNVAIYGISGILIRKFSGNKTDISVNLDKGIYIIQADGKNVKLLVATNGTGGTSVQPTAITEAPLAVYTTPPDATPLRSANAAAFKEFWNINAGNVITPIEIAKVDKFYITETNDIVFSMKDGNTVQLADYHNMSFSTQPTQSGNTKWDRGTTILYGGASYVRDPNAGSVYDMCIVAVAKDYVVAEGVLKKITNTKTPKGDIIYPNFLTKKLGYVYHQSVYKLAQFYEEWFGSVLWIEYNVYNNPYIGDSHASSRADNFDFNDNTPAIPTTFIFNADDSLTSEFTDIRTGTKYTMTFP